MNTRHDSEQDERYEHINRIQAMLLRIWGPADGWDNPLVGTKYDPALRAQRQHESLDHRRERWEQRKQHWDEVLHHHPHRHLHGHPQDGDTAPDS